MSFFKDIWKKWNKKKEWIVTKKEWDTVGMDFAEGKDESTSMYMLNEVMAGKPSVELDEELNDMWETAMAYGYERFEHQPMSSMISFFKEGIRINVYYTTMTVATCLKHPVQGKTQLFRKNVTANELEMIFRYPRVHTRKGYKKTK